MDFIILIIALVLIYIIILNKKYYGPYYIGPYMPHRFKLYHNKLITYEKKMSVWYPLGQDYFRISHGENYYNFFNRMGEVNIQVYTNKNKNIIANGCGVLRKIPQIGYAWYICDLKVDPKYRNNRLPFKMLSKTFLTSYAKSNKCYAICMNNGESEQKILRLINKMKYKNFKLKKAGLLYIYSVDYHKMKYIQGIIENYYGQSKIKEFDPTLP